MRLNHTQRLRIAHMIRAQLPWAHIIVGAVGHNFIEVSRGEFIKGSYSTGRKMGHTGSAWSRPTPGSYVLHVDWGQEWIECRRHMEPKAGESERTVGCGRWAVITPVGKGEARLRAFADWLVSRAVSYLPEAWTDGVVLAKGERFVSGPNELDENRKAVRK